MTGWSGPGREGSISASQLVNNVINFVTAFSGLASAAVVVGLLQPILLLVVLLAQLPGAWAAVRSARIRYVTRFALVDSYRRKYILADLIATRRTAAELRSFTMRAFLLDRVARLAAYARNAELTAARRRTADPGDRELDERGRDGRRLRDAGRAARLRDAAAVGRGHRGAGAPLGRGVAAAADVRGQPVLRRRAVLLGLRGVLRGRGGADPGGRIRARPDGVRADHRRPQ